MSAKKTATKKPARTAKREAGSANGSTSAKPAVGNLDFFLKKLETMQQDLQRVVAKKREEVEPEADVGDEGDVAARSVARDLVFEQAGTERRLLEEVEAALRRIEKGTYGYCESCGTKILTARLRAIPHARYCIQCQARFESF